MMKIIGRDAELTEIMNTVRNQRSFFIRGDLGTGKSAMLIWAFMNLGGLFWNGKRTYVENIKNMAEILNIEGKPTELEEEIRHVSGQIIFVDDVHKLTPKAVTLFTELLQSNIICSTLRSGIKIRDEIRPLLNGTEIEITGLRRKDALRFIRDYYFECHSAEVPANFASKCAANSLGVPRSMQISCKAKRLANVVKPSTMEIDLSPGIILLGALFIIFRVVGKADEFSTDLALLGSFSILGLFLARTMYKSISTRSEK